MAFEDGLNYLPDVVDSDLLNAIQTGEDTFDEATAVQAARNRLRAAGFVRETSLGVFTKNYGMTAQEQARYDAATSPAGIFAEVGNTVGGGWQSIVNGASSIGNAAGGLWDGLNKTLIIVSILVGVLTLHSLLKKK